MFPRVFARCRSQGKKLAQAARLLARGDLLNEQEAKQHASNQELDTALAAFGLFAEGPAASPAALPTFSLWPENLPLWQFWMQLQSQWRVGLQGPEGLDYAGVWSVLNNTVRPRQRRRYFSAIQAMEFASLQGYAERPKTPTPKHR
ncbi:MAG: DUF1799 domain-containing protein [Burkholderiales bacterium]